MTSSRTRRFGCEVEFALDVLGGKWKAVILALLKERPRHYGDLRRLVPRLSDKMLSQRLADLQNLGLIERRKVGRRGAPSEYRLTRRGNTLRPVLQALYEWGTTMARDLDAIIEPPG